MSDNWWRNYVGYSYIRNQNNSPNDIPIPRNFKLLDEHSSLYTYGLSFPSPSFGLITCYLDLDYEKDDSYLHYWRGDFSWKSSPNFLFEIYCSDEYPKEPPYFRFTRPRVDMKGVDHRGVVDWEEVFPREFKWDPIKMGIKDVLGALLKTMVDERVDVNVKDLPYPKVDLERIAMSKIWIPLWPQTHENYSLDVQEALMETLCTAQLYLVPKDIKRLLVTRVLQIF